MIELLETIVFNDFSSIFSLIFISLLIILIPIFCGLRLFSGIFMVQFTLFFNTLPIISGTLSEIIDYKEAIHFFLVEFLFFLLIVLFYKTILSYRVNIKKSLNNFLFGKGSLIIIVSMLFFTIFNFIMTPTDGSSRIAFQVNYWFSIIKPFIYIITPLATISVFILISNPVYKKRGFILFFLVVLANIFTGSKASFVMSFFSSFLILRDLVGNTDFILSRLHKILIVILLGMFVVISLFRLNTDVNHIVQRLFLSADATILVYFSDNPMAAGQGVSTLTKMHRGLARFLGDESANNIDTLFGYALNIIHTGSNTFTGPNARVSAYFRAYFDSLENFYGIIVVIMYFLLLFSVFKLSSKYLIFIPFSFPYIVQSISTVSQDFNILMMDISILSIFLIIIIGYVILPKKGKNYE